MLLSPKDHCQAFQRYLGTQVLNERLEIVNVFLKLAPTSPLLQADIIKAIAESGHFMESRWSALVSTFLIHPEYNNEKSHLELQEQGPNQCCGNTDLLFIVK